MTDDLIDARIVMSGDIVHGKPHVAGTRIMVYQVLDLLAAGKTLEEMTGEDYFPGITVEDVRLCVAFAHRVIQGP